jgi:hypothetical protein
MPPEIFRLQAGFSCERTLFRRALPAHASRLKDHARTGKAPIEARKLAGDGNYLTFESVGILPASLQMVFFHQSFGEMSAPETHFSNRFAIHFRSLRVKCGRYEKLGTRGHHGPVLAALKIAKRLGR